MTPSPFTPSHKQRRFTANKVFTDREKPVTLFRRAFDPAPPADANRVLVFYGVGGEGKTALAGHLRGLLEREYAGRAGWAAVDFEKAPMLRPAEVLLSIRLQLRRTAGLPFPAFDTAFAQWFGKTYPGADIRQRHPELFRRENETAADTYSVGLDVLKDMGEVAVKFAEVWGVGLFWKYGNRIHNRLREWWERRGNEVLRGIDVLQPDQLLDQLPAFLGADLVDAVAAMPRGARKPLAILGDTLEAFHRGEGQKAGALAFRNDRWLRELVKEAPGLLFVLLGRDPLCWAQVEPEWEPVLDQHRLGALLPEDAERYLLEVPVAEPEIRARMVEGAKGLPFYLALQVELYANLKNQARAPEPAQFGGGEPKILGRFLDHLGEAAARALAVLAHCRRFDEVLWLHLGREFMGGLPPFAFGELRGFSFVEEFEGGWLGLHALMREALCARTEEGEPVLYEQVHRCLFAWWDERCRPADVRSIAPAHELALPEAAFHRIAFKREAFSDWANERGMLFYKAARHRLVQELWETALAIEEARVPRDDLKVWRILNNLALLYYATGRYEQAEPLYQRAIAISEKTLSPEHPIAVTILNNLALLYQASGRYKQAEPLYERALAISEKTLGPEHPIVGTALNNLAELYRDTGRYERAEPFYQRAIAIIEKTLGPDHPDLATQLNNLAMLYQATGRLAEAERLYARAMTIREKTFGGEHPDVGQSLNSLAELYRDTARYEQAEPLYQRAIAISEKTLGPEHPDLATQLNNLALLYQATDRLAEAEPLYQRAIAIGEKTLGPDHPDLAIWLSNLGLLYQATDRLAEAEPLYQRAIAISEKTLGPEHPDLATQLNNLALLYQATDRLAEAEPLYQRAIAILDKNLPPDHLHQVLFRENYASILDRLGRDDEAFTLRAQAAAIRQQREQAQAHPQ